MRKPFKYRIDLREQIGRRQFKAKKLLHQRDVHSMETVDALGNGICGLIPTQKRSAGLEKVRFLPIRQKSNICHCNDIEVAFDIA